MKNKLNLLVLAIITIVANYSLSSCSSDLIIDSDTNSKNTNIELEEFLNSKDYKSFLQTKKFAKANMNISNMNIQSFEHNHMNVFTIPIEKNNELQGKLIVFSKYDGKKQQAIYEDWSKTTLLDGGDITIQDLNSRYIAAVNIVKKDNNRFSSRIVDVAQVSESPRLRSGNEFPTPDDGWYNCTTRCYKIAKDACEGDAECDFLCLLAGFGIECNISMATACAIYCL